MEYTKLGNTGMDVSRICLGCMGFGDATRWVHKWVLDEENSRPIIKRALELGINFFDTANVYSIGTSEEIVGRALRDFANRDEIVIATKVHGKMHEGQNGAGLSRKAILSEIDHSLKRLGTDYVDLYQIHRWDYETPIEETLEALHDVVKSGKAREVNARFAALPATICSNRSSAVRPRAGRRARSIRMCRMRAAASGRVRHRSSHSPHSIRGCKTAVLPCGTRLAIPNTAHAPSRLCSKRNART